MELLCRYFVQQEAGEREFEFGDLYSAFGAKCNPLIFRDNVISIFGIIGIREPYDYLFRIKVTFQYITNLY